MILSGMMAGTIGLIAASLLPSAHGFAAWRSNRVDNADGSWSKIVSPQWRGGHSAIYDPASDRIIVFGGYGAHRGMLNDVNALSLSAPPFWRPIAPLNAPPRPRWRH